MKLDRREAGEFFRRCGIVAVPTRRPYEVGKWLLVEVHDGKKYPAKVVEVVKRPRPHDLTYYVKLSGFKTVEEWLEGGEEGADRIVVIARQVPKGLRREAWQRFSRGYRALLGAIRALKMIKDDLSEYIGAWNWVRDMLVYTRPTPPIPEFWLFAQELDEAAELMVDVQNKVFAALEKFERARERLEKFSKNYFGRIPKKE